MKSGLVFGLAALAIRGGADALSAQCKQSPFEDGLFAPNGRCSRFYFTEHEIKGACGSEITNACPAIMIVNSEDAISLDSCHKCVSLTVGGNAFHHRILDIQVDDSLADGEVQYQMPATSYENLDTPATCDGSQTVPVDDIAEETCQVPLKCVDSQVVGCHRPIIPKNCGKEGQEPCGIALWGVSMFHYGDKGHLTSAECKTCYEFWVDGEEPTTVQTHNWARGDPQDAEGLIDLFNQITGGSSAECGTDPVAVPVNMAKVACPWAPPTPPTEEPEETTVPDSTTTIPEDGSTSNEDVTTVVGGASVNTAAASTCLVALALFYA